MEVLTLGYKTKGGSVQETFSAGNKVLEVQILEPQSPALYIVIVLSCPLIGSRSSGATANQGAEQNNCRALGSQDLYFLKFFTCKQKISFPNPFHPSVSQNVLCSKTKEKMAFNAG